MQVVYKFVSKNFFACNIGSKISFTPKGGRFCEENFLRYLDFCYVNPVYHKLKTFPLL